VAVALIAASILQLNLNFKQGADALVALTVVDANGAPITNPTGYSVRAQIRVTPTGPVLFEWNTTPGAGIGTATITYTEMTQTTTVALVLTKAQSALFTWGSALWDCVVTSPANQTACIAEGTVAIDPAITY
jgi:hypothetical protein